MEVATVALGTLLPKLAELLQGEYKLQKGVRKDIELLSKELETIHASLGVVSEVPREQLTDPVRIWARDVRELSYRMEDVVDTFLVRVRGPDAASKKITKRLIKKMFTIVSKSTVRHQIGEEIKDIKKRVEEVADRHKRYNVDAITPAAGTTIDPRITALYTKETDLVGINEAREELITLLTKEEDISAQQHRIVSIVGFGGLGKTTLARAVLEKLKVQFDCTAFFSVSQKPDMKKFFIDMLYAINEANENMHNEANKNIRGLGVNRLIDRVRKCLQNKRYLVIIDDIWDTSSWDIIRCALPDDNDGYRVITTTRDFTVARHIGGAYKMKPLSLKNSRILMYARIFGKEDEHKYLDEHLAKVSDRILKKCAGVPLAIITIASLLASKEKNKLDWEDVCNSIGNGLEEDSTIENMRKILSLSYYNMPSHLRTCLLHLSVFPEDYEIKKDRLIRLWIAEDVIQRGKQNKSLSEMAETCFNELVNRSMIQIVSYKYYNNNANVCRVHDMVLDLICSLSREENFVTIWNDMGDTSPSDKDRRLSLQIGKADYDKHRVTVSMEHVRSVVVFPPAIGLMPALSRFRVLRVLDLEDCDLPQGYNLKYLKNLLHLRYLSLRGCQGVGEILEEIGNLQFLQTLDLWDTGITTLPLAIVQLRHLMFVTMNYLSELPKRIGTITTLEELPKLKPSHDYMNIIEELSHLTELRRLHIEDMHCDAGLDITRSLAEGLKKLKKIQSLEFSGRGWDLDGWDVAPRQIRTLVVKFSWFSVLSTWVNPSHVADLSGLEIQVRKLQQEDFEILGRLPSLRSLELKVDHVNLGIHGRLVAGARSFQCLEYCGLEGFGGRVVFRQGAMPRLTDLELEIQCLKDYDLWGYGSWGFGGWQGGMRSVADLGFDLDLGNLPSLQDVRVWLRSEGTHDEEVVLTHAFEIQFPNNPGLRIFRTGFDWLM